MTSNEWTSSIQSHVRKLSKECYIMALVHATEADRCCRINMSINAVVIIMNMLLSILEIINVVENDINKVKIWSLVGLCINLIFLTLSQINLFGRFEERKSKNLQTSADFGVLHRSINQILMLNYDRRPPAEKYQSHIYDIYEKILNYSPYVSIKHKDKYKNISITISVYTASSDDTNELSNEMQSPPPFPARNKQLTQNMVRRSEISNVKAQLQWEMDRFEHT